MTTDRPLALPHAVYWIYGDHDLILYIGITRHLRVRLSTHKRKQRDTWWPMVQRYEVEWYPNFHAAKAIETSELRCHRPMCNPVIPEESGKHITVLPGRLPVRSLFSHTSEMAAENGETVTALVTRALEREVRRMKRSAPTADEK